MQTTRPAGRSALAIAAEVGGAIVGGLILAPLSAYLVGLLLLSAQLGMGLLSLQVFAAVIGFGVGAGAGAAVAGRLLGQQGRAWPAMLAGGAAGVLVVLVMRLLNVGGLLGILGVGAPLVLVAAVLAYNLVRRP